MDVFLLWGLESWENFHAITLSRNSCSYFNYYAILLITMHDKPSVLSTVIIEGLQYKTSRWWNVWRCCYSCFHLECSSEGWTILWWMCWDYTKCRKFSKRDRTNRTGLKGWTTNVCRYSRSMTIIQPRPRRFGVLRRCGTRARDTQRRGRGWTIIAIIIILAGIATYWRA